MPRNTLESGASKRRNAKDKRDKFETVLSTNKRISDFVTFTPENMQPGPVVVESQAVVIEEQFSELSEEGTSGMGNNSIDIQENSGSNQVCSEFLLKSDIPNSSTDPSLWFPLTLETAGYWINKITTSGLDHCRNKSESDHYPSSKRYWQPSKPKPQGHYRYFSNSMFYAQKTNGEEQLYKWILYSPSKGSIYCLFCVLMNSRSSQFAHSDGFSDWNHARNLIRAHNESEMHRDCVINICNRQGNQRSQIDYELHQQCGEQKKYWREVLLRVVKVTSFLAERGLAFRGSNEKIGSVQNGNFLGCIELIAQFDPFLATHLKNFGDKGTGNPSYLSSTIFEEFVESMADEVRDTIVKEIRAAKYFSVSVDSTPDISNVDQLTVIIRYVQNGKAVEHFLTFLQISSHTGEQLASTLLEYLRLQQISFSDCRGQSYDNASNMSGRYSGMQARLKQLNPLALFVPCAAHSLNLVGGNAADSCLEAVNFFGLVQKIYTFLSASTHRWSVLMTKLKANHNGLTVKSLSATRWSARADAIHALFEGYETIRSSLQQIADDDLQTAETRNEAVSLTKKMNLLETAILCCVWNSILTRFNATSKSLQKADIDIKVAVDLLLSLQEFVNSLREQFDDFETQARQFTGTTEFKESHSRKRKRTTRYDYDDSENRRNEEAATPQSAPQTAKDSFRSSTYLAIIDSINTALKDRISAYSSIYSRFRVVLSSGFLSDIEIQEECRKLAADYPTDLSPLSFSGEMTQFLAFARQRDCTTPQSRAELIELEGLQQTFPNVDIALRMGLSIMATNCTGERSFSKLNIIKNRLRSSMDHMRLSSLAILSIESELLRTIKFDTLIEKFASSKARKVPI